MFGCRCRTHCASRFTICFALLDPQCASGSMQDMLQYMAVSQYCCDCTDGMSSLVKALHAVMLCIATSYSTETDLSEKYGVMSSSWCLSSRCSYSADWQWPGALTVRRLVELPLRRFHCAIQMWPVPSWHQGKYLVRPCRHKMGWERHRCFADEGCTTDRHVSIQIPKLLCSSVAHNVLGGLLQPVGSDSTKLSMCV